MVSVPRVHTIVGVYCVCITIWERGLKCSKYAHLRTPQDYVFERIDEFSYNTDAVATYSTFL